MGAPVTIVGYRHYAYKSPEGVRFSDLNILGADFCGAQGVGVAVDYQGRWVKLYFGGGWEVVEEDKQ